MVYDIAYMDRGWPMGIGYGAQAGSMNKDDDDDDDDDDEWAPLRQCSACFGLNDDAHRHYL